MNGPVCPPGSHARRNPAARRARGTSTVGRAPRHGGLSLIEVLAAMVIFSAGAVILFGWIAQTADRLGKLSVEQQALFGQLEGLEYIRGVNPMARPEGEAQLGETRIRWRSEAIGDESTVRYGGGLGNYVVRLYQVRLTTQASGTDSAEQAVYLSGWRELPQSGTAPFANPALPPTTGPNAPR